MAFPGTWCGVPLLRRWRAGGGILMGLLTPGFAIGEMDPAESAQRLFAQHCLECHGPDKQEGRLRLDEAESVARVVEEGALLERVTTSEPDERMPPKGDPLGDPELEVIRDWLAAGGQLKRHWAYEPIQKARAASFSAARSGWGRNEIDTWVHARLVQEEVSPSAEADRSTLIKRLYYDLLGLPPSPEVVEAFIQERSPNAYERLVDRLLASVHFGERWGRHWLDKARYADSDGYEKDRPRPTAWHYRDWVIDAVNADLPMDTFTVEQLAGDLLPEAKPAQLLATAFHRQTLTNTEGGTDQEQFRVEAVFDRAETTGAIWLGLTFNCARCHHHKYDAISQEEYYQLFAFFNDGDESSIKLPKKLGEGMDDVAVVRAHERETRVLERGDFLRPAAPVLAGGLRSLPDIRGRRGPDHALDRLDLAHWLMHESNPLTPRVLANQVWERLFGRGLVSTLNDFGVRGEPPTHPELLDWLGQEFRRLAWSRKRMIQTVVTSATYRQESKHRRDLEARDPTNRWLARQNRIRVEAEIVRDLCLSVSGLLSREVGGPSVFPPMPPEIAALSYANSFKWTNSDGGNRYRRGLYTFFKRTAPHPNLIAFDCPDSNTSALQRRRSNTPIQALTMLNNEVFVEAARALGEQLLREVSHESDEVRLASLLKRCVARVPEAHDLAKFRDLLHACRVHYGSAEGREDARNLVGKVPDAHPLSEIAAWVAVARIALNLDEFITRE